MAPMMSTKELIAAVAAHLDIDAGFVTYEYPGCVVIPHADRSGDAWWFGTANDTWQGDRMRGDGTYAGETLITDVMSTSQDPGEIAIAIAKALLEPDAPITATSKRAIRSAFAARGEFHDEPHGGVAFNAHHTGDIQNAAGWPAYAEAQAAYFAEEITNELEDRPDVIAALKAPGADFVFIEEGLSRAITEGVPGLDDAAHRALYLKAFGLVMKAIAHHGITPPAWFLREPRPFDPNDPPTAPTPRTPAEERASALAAAEAGGPMSEEEGEAFDALYPPEAPTTPPAVFRRGTFSIDSALGEIRLAGWTTGDTWNGFACPSFERAEAEELMRRLNASTCEGDARVGFDASADAFTVRTTDFEPEDEPDRSEGHEILTPEGPRHVYSIGAYSWTWSEIEPRTEEEWNEYANEAIAAAREELNALITRTGVVFENLTHASQYCDVNTLAGMDQGFAEYVGDSLSEASATWHTRALRNLDHWLRRGRRATLAEHEFELTFDVPNAVIMEPGIVDSSWHNDSMPTFTFPEIDACEPHPDVRLWIDHPVQSLREITEQADRFAVYNHTLDEPLYAGDDVEEALRILRTARDQAAMEHAAACPECERSYGPHFAGECEHN